MYSSPFPLLWCIFAQGFDELLALAESGDHRKIDMLVIFLTLHLLCYTKITNLYDFQVKDIYGGDCTSLGLPGDLIASSFGKATQAAPESIQGIVSLTKMFFLVSQF